MSDDIIMIRHGDFPDDLKVVTINQNVVQRSHKPCYKVGILLAGAGIGEVKRVTQGHSTTELFFPSCVKHYGEREKNANDVLMKGIFINREWNS